MRKCRKIPCPQIVQVYKLHMGEVKLLDLILGYYRIRIRSKQWYMRLYFHFLDLTVVNAWSVSRRVRKELLPLGTVHDRDS